MTYVVHLVAKGVLLGNMLMSIHSGWMTVGAVFVAGFAIQAKIGTMIYRQAPPIPSFTVKGKGAMIVFSKEDVLKGQEVWQSFGGMQMGSIWGHGALQAPDWSAEWLHREAVATIEIMKTQSKEQDYVTEMRANTYDATTDEAWITNERAEAVKVVSDYYIALFTGAKSDPADANVNLVERRAKANMKDTTLLEVAKAKQLCAFLFWASWSCATQRPGHDVTYTNNWPQEALIENAPSSDVTYWSVVSFLLLLLGIGIVSWQNSSEMPEAHPAPESDPLLGMVVTPSMRSIKKWVWTMVALTLVQLTLGIYIGHLAVNKMNIKHIYIYIVNSI